MHIGGVPRPPLCGYVHRGFLWEGYRAQSHAHLTFANAVCLQYAEVEVDHFVDDESTDSDCAERDRDIKDFVFAPPPLRRTEEVKCFFKEQFKGCPILKFQVVNDFCNKGGGEIIDGVMKVIGVKMKRFEGKISHTQYVRVNLVDFEHPFFGRVWQCVHILDATSPLLTETAKQTIIENSGRWPDKWLEHHGRVRHSRIRRKLDFDSLIVTVAGVSNISACTVHGYKRYKFEDVIIGFDFAPLVYENEKTGKLEVDMCLVDDVREQHKGRGEDLKSSVDADSRRESIIERGTEFSRGKRGTTLVLVK